MSSASHEAVPTNAERAIFWILYALIAVHLLLGVLSNPEEIYIGFIIRNE